MVFQISRETSKDVEKPRLRYYTTLDLYSDDDKNIYLEKTKVSYMSLFLLGFMPLTFKKTGQGERVEYRATSRESIYSMVVLTTAFCIHAFTVVNNVTRIKEAKKFNDVFTALFDSFTTAPLISKFLSFSLEISRSRAFITDWHMLQIHYQRVTGKRFKTILQQFERTTYMTHFWCTFIPLCLFSELRFAKKITWKRVVEQISYTYNATCAWELAGFWYVNTQCLRLILEDLKAEVRQATEDFQLQLLFIRPTKEQRMAGFEFQIKVFLQALRSFPPIVSASGLFTITRKTFLAILASALTNFLIMEQFKVSEKECQAAKNRTHNATATC
ncbi:unnamed protein product [Bemisia tabaci]|uniref:Gustatory receptor n=1 Tax=Bemisia tabaci TaxID=7038 RepID=A0A9P0F8Q4_BEMTA|nr:unnamed protein product [Bemisia tabaci]